MDLALSFGKRMRLYEMKMAMSNENAPALAPGFQPCNRHDRFHAENAFVKLKAKRYVCFNGAARGAVEHCLSGVVVRKSKCFSPLFSPELAGAVELYSGRRMTARHFEGPDFHSHLPRKSIHQPREFPKISSYHRRCSVRLFGQMDTHRTVLNTLTVLLHLADADPETCEILCAITQTVGRRHLMRIASAESAPREPRSSPPPRVVPFPNPPIE